MASEEEPTYVPKDAIRESVRSGMILGGFGTMLAATQNTLARKNYGPLGMFTHFGSTVVIFGSSREQEPPDDTSKDEADRM